MWWVKFKRYDDSDLILVAEHIVGVGGNELPDSANVYTSFGGHFFTVKGSPLEVVAMIRDPERTLE